MLIDFRCRNCNRLLGKYKDCKQLEIKCPRCGYDNQIYLRDREYLKESSRVEKIKDKT